MGPCLAINKTYASSTKDQGHVRTCSLSRPGGSLILGPRSFPRDPFELLHPVTPSWYRFLGTGCSLR